MAFLAICLYRIGEAEVPVANCGESYFDSHSKSNWILKDFITYMVEYKGKGYSSTMPCLYLKVDYQYNVILWIFIT